MTEKVKFEFRCVEIEDFENVMKVYGEARRAIGKLMIDQWQGGYPSENIVKNDIDKGYLYAAYSAEDGIIAAVAALLPYEADYEIIDGEWLFGNAAAKRYFAVHRVAASDEFRGCGASRFLMENIEKRAKKLGAASLRIDTHRGNVVMQKFLNKMGFEKCGIITLCDGEGDRKRIAYEKMIAEDCIFQKNV